jgi:hypothetical protein
LNKITAVELCTNVQAKNVTRHYANTLLAVRPFSFYVNCLFILSVVVRWLGGSFAFFVWLCVSAKMQMCHQKR